ncbi:hypothetical protein [Deinococcus sp. PEB2-63]
MKVYVATAQCPVSEPDSCVVLRMDEQAVTILALDLTRQVIPAAQFHRWYEPYRGRPFTVDAHGTVVYQEPP